MKLFGKKPTLKKGRSVGEVLEQLYGPKLTQKTLSPVKPSENATDNLKKFFAETEWMQPAFNQRVGGHGFRFHEENTPWVSLGTYDGPDDGRTFEVSFGSLMVGTVAVVPDLFPENARWAELRVRLNYPADLIDGKFIHGFLMGLVELTQSFESNAVFEDIQNDSRARSWASQAMAEAMWNKSAFPENTSAIELSVSGPFGNFKALIDHWKTRGLDPWERWERRE
jgi:hypothetical protein